MAHVSHVALTRTITAHRPEAKGVQYQTVPVPGHLRIPVTVTIPAVLADPMVAVHVPGVPVMHEHRPAHAMLRHVIPVITPTHQATQRRATRIHIR